MGSNQDKIILDLCGGTGNWSNPYKETGYDVHIISPSGIPLFDRNPQNVKKYEPPANVYGILAAPPCTKFSFARTNANKDRDLNGAMEIVAAVLHIIWKCQARVTGKSPKTPYLKFWAIENPFGMLNWFLGKPALEFNPYDYGDRYQKKTCLWGHFVEPKKSPVELTTNEKIKFDQRLNDVLPDLPADYSCPPGFDKRAARRSLTPPGFAKAFFEANK